MTSQYPSIIYKIRCVQAETVLCGGRDNRGLSESIKTLCNVKTDTHFFLQIIVIVKKEKNYMRLFYCVTCKDGTPLDPIYQSRHSVGETSISPDQSLIRPETPNT